MDLSVQNSTETEIAQMRIAFLEEANVQFIHNKCHDYGWADVYIFQQKDGPIGYASIWGLNDRSERDTLFEFYLTLENRGMSDLAFTSLMAAVDFKYIECQTNIPLQAEMMFRYGTNIHPESILFSDRRQPGLPVNDTVFRKRTESDSIYREDDGPFVLLYDDKIVAHGGLMYNYNKPYADIYMHVFDEFRNRGFGAQIVQALKMVAYSENKVPAARCHINNKPSRKTLEKAGFDICGYLLVGDIRK